MRHALAALGAVVAATVTLAEPAVVIPVAGSTAGAFQSNFKTELQLHNASAQPMSGTLIFHPQGRSASASDPSVRYALAPHETLHFRDLVGAMGVTGLGSVDVVPDANGVPTVVTRAYDDQGELGTSGTTVPAVAAGEALRAGTRALLVAPSDRTAFRFNIGTRTLADGAALRWTLYSASGVARKSVEVHRAANLFVQQSAEALLQDLVLGSESIVVEVLAGSAIVYATTTDNVTNDPAIQLARTISE